MSLAVLNRLIACCAMLRHSFRKPALSLTSKYKTRVTACDNNPDVIQLFAQQCVTCETLFFTASYSTWPGSDVRITEVK
jgi:hypothetical protein